MMKTIEYTTIDKSGWGSGAWQNEPDKKQWRDITTGLPCLAVRNSHSGHWCGYVGVAEGHPSYGRDYDSVSVEVHGGLTFSDRCHEGADPSRFVCHIAGDGEPDHVWWLGFDCGHYGDSSPAYEARHGDWPRDGHEVYRTLRYVERQCATLAKQLAAMPPAPLPPA